MNGENKTKSGEPQKEEKEFLARGEVKTMKKDIAQIRETESKEEMGRMAKIKTEQEIKKEEERKLKAEKEAQEREAAEKQAQSREKELVTMKEEREKKEAVLDKEEIETQEAKARGLQDALKNTQAKEEAERKMFLERVAAKAEGKEIPLMAPLKPPVQPMTRTEAQKPAKKKKLSFKIPTSSQKLWIRAVVSFLTLALLAGVITFWYWYFVVRTQGPKEAVTEVKETNSEQAAAPRALIATDRRQTLVINQLDEIPNLISQKLAGEAWGDDILTRLVIENEARNKIIGLDEFLAAFNIVPPAGFIESLDNDFTLFSYSQEEGGRFGFVAKINSPDNLKEALSSWEDFMESDFENLFAVLDYKGPALVSYFKDGDYQDSAFRFQTFSRQDVGIVYAVYNNYFVFTVSWKSMEKALDKLKEGPPPVSFSPQVGAEFILKNMTLAEKIGQLFLIGVKGQSLSQNTEELIKRVKPGGVILFGANISSPDQVIGFINDLQRVSLNNTGLPLLIAVDQEGGDVNRLPFIQETTPQSAIGNEQQAYQVGYRRAQELKAVGINLNLAPMLDTTSPGDFLFNRSFQKEADDIGDVAKALVQGQSAAGILTAIKHFPGYGDVNFNPEKELATITELPETGQFRKVMSARPEIVMTSNAVYPGIDPDAPFSFSPEGIKLLKESLDGQYLIMTDDLSQSQITDNFSAKDIVLLPVRAGADVLIFSSWDPALKAAALILGAAVADGGLAETRVDESVLKIIKLKQSLL